MTDEYSRSMCWLALAISEWNSSDEIRKYQRFPQFVWNRLSYEKPNLLNQIIGTEKDFFHDDFLTKEKWVFIGENWSNYDS